MEYEKVGKFRREKKESPAVEELTAVLGVPGGLLSNLPLQLTHLVPHTPRSLTELFEIYTISNFLTLCKI